MEALTENFQNNPAINPAHQVHILKLRKFRADNLYASSPSSPDFQSTSNPDWFSSPDKSSHRSGDRLLITLAHGLAVQAGPIINLLSQ
jgi:hypothetical protein